MWSQGASEDDDTLANALIDISERQIADLTAVCEPILAWDGKSKVEVDSVSREALCGIFTLIFLQREQLTHRHLSFSSIDSN